MINYAFQEENLPHHEVPAHIIKPPRINHEDVLLAQGYIPPKRKYVDECLTFANRWTSSRLLIMGTYVEEQTIGVIAQYHPPVDQADEKFEFNSFTLAIHNNMSQLVPCEVSKSVYPRSTGFLDIHCRSGFVNYFSTTDQLNVTLIVDTKENGRELVNNLIACTLKPTQSRHYFTVSTQFKDRAPFLKEWIEYYLLIGATHFYLYDHGSTDNPLEVLKEYIDRNIVTYVSWNAPVIHNTPFSTVQPPTFTHSLANFRKFSRWIAFFDIDEFIIPAGVSYEKNKTIIPILKQYDRDDVAALKLADVDFLGPKILDRPEYVIEHYNLRSKGASFKKGKTIAKAPAVKRMAIHDIGRAFQSHAKTVHVDYENEMRMNHYRCAHRRQAHKQCNNMNGNYEDTSIYVYLPEIKKKLKE